MLRRSKRQQDPLYSNTTVRRRIERNNKDKGENDKEVAERREANARLAKPVQKWELDSRIIPIQEKLKKAEREVYFTNKIAVSTTSLVAHISEDFVKHLEARKVKNIENQRNTEKLKQDLSEFQERYEYSKDKIETYAIALRCQETQIFRLERQVARLEKSQEKQKEQLKELKEGLEKRSN